MKPHIKYVGAGSWLCTEYSFIRAARFGCVMSIPANGVASGDTPEQAYRRRCNGSKTQSCSFQQMYRGEAMTPEQRIQR